MKMCKNGAKWEKMIHYEGMIRRIWEYSVKVR